MAWQWNSPEVTVKDFRRCYTSNVVEGTNDDMLWNGSEGYGVRSECEEDESCDCKDGKSDTDWYR